MNLSIAVWMMRPFLAEVPPAIIEAASIDGANTLQIMRKIVAPVFVNTLNQTEHSYLAEFCAGTVLSSVAVLFAGLAAQDKLVQGRSLGAVK